MKKRILSGLEPEAVFRHFEELAAIPHGSGNEQGVSELCADFAKAHGLRYIRDEANNVIIFKDGTAGYEDRPPVILQGHLDMVCAPREGSGIDMAVTPLDLFVEGDLIGARDTSLGADDGIAVAMMLALLEADDIPHPPIEALFTTDEETGMTGANAVDLSVLRGRKMINLDSEEEGVFTVGCAGGVRVRSRRVLARELFCGQQAKLSVNGLLGGHSGAEIHCGRANSNIVMGRLLRRICEVCDCRLVSLSGGTKDNVIASATEAVIVFETSRTDAVSAAVKEFRQEFLGEFGQVEKNAAVTLTLTDSGEVSALSAADTADTASVLADSPFGPIAWNKDIPGMVQTSDNLGIVLLDGDTLEVDWSVRSSVSAEKDALAERICALAEKHGLTPRLTSPYPAWEYRADSPLRDTMTEVWREMTGSEPIVCTIHAGLECGLFSEKLKGLDAVSMGPRMQDIHSCLERLSISSVGRTWEYLKKVLERL